MFWYVEQLSMTAIRFNTGGPSSFYERGRDVTVFNTTPLASKSHIRVHEMSLGHLWF